MRTGSATREPDGSREDLRPQKDGASASMYKKVSDYGITGNLRKVALVGLDG